MDGDGLVTGETWQPGLEMDGLPGRSAWSIMGIVLLSVPPGIVLGIGISIRGEGYGGSTFLTSVMVLILIDDVAFVLVATIWFGFRRTEEVRAGYTTVANEFPHLPQVDPTTGMLIRLAVEPLPSREERRGLIRRIPATIGAGGSTKILDDLSSNDWVG